MLIAAAVVAFATRAGAILASHPAYAITLVLVALGGAGFVWRGTRRRRSEPAAGRRIVPRIVLVAVVVLIAGVTWVLRPVAATQVAIDALQDGAGVEVTSTATRIEMTPTDPAGGAGLVFYPGGLVDPRAYAGLLRPIAEAGYPVVIVKPPYGIGFLARGAAADIVQSSEADIAWVVGGHSLGGVAAAAAANDGTTFDRLALWAAFPAGNIADRNDLAVTSIFGSEDRLTTPEAVAESAADLPPDTLFVEIEGGIHSYFGDYGPQRGDGTATVARPEAQRQIVDATLDLLRSVAAEQS